MRTLAADGTDRDVRRHAVTDAGQLSTRAGAGARWGIVTAAVVQLSTIVSTLAAARVLRPKDFAIVGAATVVTGLFAIFGQGGFGASMVVGSVQDKRSQDTYFWGALGIGVILVAVAAAGAPWTARAVGLPGAAWAIRVLALTIPLGMVTSVLQGIMLKELRYGASAASDLVTALATAVLPVVLLLAGLGPWAMIISSVAGAAAGVVALFMVGRWRPSRRFDGKLMRSQARFNVSYLGTTGVSYVNKNADYWVLGHVVSASVFGAYYVAFVVPTIIRQRVTLMATQVATPLLVKVRHDADLLRAGYERILRSVAAVMVPAMVGVAVCADLVVRIAFGPRWGLAVEPLRVLAVASAIECVSVCANCLFLARQEVSVLLRRSLLRAVFFLGSLGAVAYFRTPTSAAFAVLVGTLAGAVFTQISVARATNTRHRRLATLLGPLLVATAAMAVGVAALLHVADGLPAAVTMAMAVVAGVGLYLGTLRVFFASHFGETFEGVRLIIGR
ncbi:MAG: putative polysaccharide transport protein [Acidimicrobiales bacterium]|nr:putative polysaccharide transport protein [Acidimicrobiales bacterium]